MTLRYNQTALEKIHDLQMIFRISILHWKKKRFPIDMFDCQRVYQQYPIVSRLPHYILMK